MDNSNERSRLLRTIRAIVRQEVIHYLQQQENDTTETVQVEPCHHSHPNSWAIFGEPEPVKGDQNTLKKERPRALPGWSQPYRPEFNGLESTPYLPTQNK
ncbi:hypothetical protein IC620_02140 [Hazenella sp. IB182357]|uniref:Uncharacterized protein n=1 Tax=Polycladospora coralii TaxID=2771432 RepID=A0A926RTH1_9BACL|nr:hypothetical protein [Polycladospora coralii]MBD1371159.1 hypothetical protein [Polycladospora coralii]